MYNLILTLCILLFNVQYSYLQTKINRKRKIEKNKYIAIATEKAKINIKLVKLINVSRKKRERKKE